MEWTDQKILEQYRRGQREFAGVELEDGDLSGQDLPGIMFTNGCYLAINFSGANLRGATFLDSNIKTCIFRQADLTDARFENLLVDGADFAAAIGEGTIFRNNTYHSDTLQQADFEQWVNET